MIRFLWAINDAASRFVAFDGTALNAENLDSSKSSYRGARGANSDGENPRPTVSRRGIKLIASTVAAMVLWPLAQIGLIAAEAQYYADGRPYCIDVVNYHLSYRPAASLLELNGFTMRAPFVNLGGSGSHSFAQRSFHALLVIDAGGEQEWRNWSYWHEHFDSLSPEQTRAVSPACQPQVDFVRTLPLLPS